MTVATDEPADPMFGDAPTGNRLPVAAPNGDPLSGDAPTGDPRSGDAPTGEGRTDPLSGGAPTGEGQTDALSGGLDDVVTLRWPADASRRHELIDQGRARLVVVAPGERPPDAPDGLEDWIRDAADPVEVFVRKERLRRRQAARAPAVLDGDGLLHRGPHWVALTSRELPAATRLLARPGALVPRAELLGVTYPEVVSDEHRRLDTLMRRLHRRIAPLGLAVHCVRAGGFLLEVGELPA